jgi:hypothetical protein
MEKMHITIIRVSTNLIWPLWHLDTWCWRGFPFLRSILLITVTEGSIEWYDQNCEVTVYNVGDALTENTQTYFVRNVGLDSARFMVTSSLRRGSRDESISQH